MIFLLLFDQQQQHLLPPLALSMKSFIRGGLLPGGLPLPSSPSSSSKKKHYNIVSQANENTLMKIAPIKNPITPATIHGKYGDDILSWK
jgi:hypothetical protein